MIGGNDDGDDGKVVGTLTWIVGWALGALRGPGRTCYQRRRSWTSGLVVVVGGAGVEVA